MREYNSAIFFFSVSFFIISSLKIEGKFIHVERKHVHTFFNYYKKLILKEFNTMDIDLKLVVFLQIFQKQSDKNVITTKDN